MKTKATKHTTTKRGAKKISKASRTAIQKIATKVVSRIEKKKRVTEPAPAASIPAEQVRGDRDEHTARTARPEDRTDAEKKEIRHQAAIKAAATKRLKAGLPPLQPKGPTTPAPAPARPAARGRRKSATTAPAAKLPSEADTSR